MIKLIDLKSGIGLGLLLTPAFVLADSGVGVDTWRSNKLDPTGGQATQLLDPNGTSWLKPGQSRTPTGYLCLNPADPPKPDPLGIWQTYGTFDVGYLHLTGEKYALYDRYTRWPSSGTAFDADVNFERPSDGTYAEVRGSHVSREDQYYQAVFGKAGAYKAEVFVRDMPNLLSTDARPIWNAVGSNHLTLPGNLTPGGSTPAQVAAVSAATAVTALAVQRNKQGLALSAYLTPRWSVYLNATDEQRRGDRPYGGPFAENWSGSTGANLETVKPIDDSTINLNAGVRFASTTWRAEVGYSGSVYRDKYLSYDFQNPFTLGPQVATPFLPQGLTLATLAQGQMSTEPDNDYHSIQATLTRVLPQDGEVSLSVSEVLMEQRDKLIAPTNCQGVFGGGIPSPGSTQVGVENLGPQNPTLYPCSQWNTTAALSQQIANVNMHNTLVAGALVLRPAETLTFNGGLKYYRQKYKNNYIGYNPENGQYGYIAENGALSTVFGGLPLTISGTFSPSAAPPLFAARYLPYLLSMEEYSAYGRLTWKAPARNTLSLVYAFDEYRPTSRERTRVDDNSLKLTWVNRALNWVTLRASYTLLRQSGDTYSGNVYGYALTSALPAFIAAYPKFPSLAETVDAMRKYDLSDRREHRVDLMATVAPREDMTVSASLRGDWNRYSAVIGRQGHDTLGATLQWEWQPLPASSASAYLGYDRSSLHIASVSGSGGLDGSLGGPGYPLANRWFEADKERNYSAGATFRQRLAFATVDLGYNYIYSRGITSYSAVSPGALENPADFAIMGSAFPGMTYHVNSVTASVTAPLTSRVSLRVFDYYERGNIGDWHYAGFKQTLVYRTSLYTDAGPQSYSNNLVGVFVNITL